MIALIVAFKCYQEHSQWFDCGAELKKKIKVPKSLTASDLHYRAVAGTPDTFLCTQGHSSCLYYLFSNF